jgi:hypothetical protein
MYAAEFRHCEDVSGLRVSVMRTVNCTRIAFSQNPTEKIREVMLLAYKMPEPSLTEVATPPSPPGGGQKLWAQSSR